MFTKLMGLLGGGSVTLYLWIGAALLFGALTFGVKHYYSAYHEEISANEVLKSKNSELVEKIKSDSDATAKLAADSASRAAAAKLALEQAQKKQREAERRAGVILLTSPVDPVNVCVSADSLFNQYISGAIK